ncbi:hypothetical protein QJQ45_003694 [Haematococcus lacustris]|nr:hypothetical protein QJQ45_003694 [Haematococcus lacustris]
MLSHLETCVKALKFGLSRRIPRSSVRAMTSLSFDNLTLRTLQVDDSYSNAQRPVRGASFALMSQLEPLERPQLVAYSAEALGLLDLTPEQAHIPATAAAELVAAAVLPALSMSCATCKQAQEPDFVASMAGNKLLPGSQPAAHCYCGHQFGHFSGQLGDGAAMYLGEVVNSRGERWELQLKGAGPTPFSRGSDGRKVLRSSIREFLASEAMFHLSVVCFTSCRPLLQCVVRQRVSFRPGAGNAIRERATVVSRIAPTFLRFGSFQIFLERDDITGRAGPSVGLEAELLPGLLQHTMRTYFPDLWQQHGGDQLASSHTQGNEPAWHPLLKAWFAEVVRRTAALVARWQAVGWCHGVLNTDNMSIVGVTIDYGPYGFLDTYDPDHICNGSDDSGRYRFKAQPDICRWNCKKLAEAVSWALPLEQSLPLLEEYDAEYERTYLSLMRRKLGLVRTSEEGDAQLVTSLLQVMADCGADWTNSWRVLARVPLPAQDSAAASGASSGFMQCSLGNATLLQPPSTVAFYNGGIATAPVMLLPPPLLLLLLVLVGAAAEEVLTYLVAQCTDPGSLAASRGPRIPPQQLQMLLRLAAQQPDMLRSLGLTPQQVADEVEALKASQVLLKMSPQDKLAKDRAAWSEWLARYSTRLQAEVAAGTSAEERTACMNSSNPRYVLRNWMAQNAIDAAEKFSSPIANAPQLDFSEVRALLDLLRDPFTTQGEDAAFAATVRPASPQENIPNNAQAGAACSLRKYDGKPPAWAKEMVRYRQEVLQPLPGPATTEQVGTDALLCATACDTASRQTMAHTDLEIFQPADEPSGGQLLSATCGLYDPLRLLSAWGQTNTPCDGSWYGVGCDGGGRVVSLVLARNASLAGPLPDAIKYLTDLQSLYLTVNQLTGSLPSSWSALTNLDALVLRANQLSGPLPPQWSSLANLRTLSLGANRLTGTIPASWQSGMSSLQFLDLSGNQLLCGALPNVPGANPGALNTVPAPPPAPPPSPPQADDGNWLRDHWWVIVLVVGVPLLLLLLLLLVLALAWRRQAQQAQRTAAESLETNKALREALLTVQAQLATVQASMQAQATSAGKGAAGGEETSNPLFTGHAEDAAPAGAVPWTASAGPPGEMARIDVAYQHYFSMRGPTTAASAGPASSALLTSLLFMPAQVLPLLQPNNARNEGLNGRPNDDRCPRAPKKGPPKKPKASRSAQGKQLQERRDGWNTHRRQVIKVPGGAVLRGCKKTKRKLMAHFQLRAGVHSQLRAKLTKGKHGSGLNNARHDTERWLAPIKPHLQHLAAASSAGTSLEANLKHITVTLATWDAVWEVYLYPKWARQRLRLYGAQDRALEQFFMKLEGDMAEVSMQRHGRPGQLVVFFGAAGIGTRGGWGADAVLRACCKVLNKRRATRPAGWKPPAGQVEHRLVRTAWSQQRDQPVRGMMWCPVGAPRKPPQPPRNSQEATQTAASEPGPSTPLPAKRSKRTKAEPAAEPNKGKGKAAKAKPAPQPGRWLDRDCNAALNMQRIGESKWRPLELCFWPEQGKLPAKGKEYPGLGYQRLRDKPPKAQEQQPAVAQLCVPPPT